MTLDELNGLSDKTAVAELTKCCGSHRWTAQMATGRPFENEDELFQQAEKVWFACTEPDWLEAFSHHPKIGDTASLEKKFSSTKEWAGNEQKGVESASKATIQRLSELNEVYEKRFGFIFIVCATGKSASEMLELLEARIGNDYREELDIAMREQHKITCIRLKKLLT